MMNLLRIIVIVLLQIAYYFAKVLWQLLGHQNFIDYMNQEYGTAWSNWYIGSLPANLYGVPDTTNFFESFNNKIKSFLKL